MSIRIKEANSQELHITFSLPPISWKEEQILDISRDCSGIKAVKQQKSILT
jgi:hypothetical protein